MNTTNSHFERKAVPVYRAKSPIKSLPNKNNSKPLISSVSNIEDIFLKLIKYHSTELSGTYDLIPSNSNEIILNIIKSLDYFVAASSVISPTSKTKTNILIANINKYLEDDIPDKQNIMIAETNQINLSPDIGSYSIPALMDSILDIILYLIIQTTNVLTSRVRVNRSNEITSFINNPDMCVGGININLFLLSKNLLSNVEGFRIFFTGSNVMISALQALCLIPKVLICPEKHSMIIAEYGGKLYWSCRKKHINKKDIRVCAKKGTFFEKIELSWFKILVFFLSSN